ncbi:MAG: MaoC family dehydratase N-terminal domain-containing protein [bacterium]|nr:MaoC family dehydratase N-terminal domain-containing protein [bacterium]
MTAPSDAVGRTRESVDELGVTPALHLAATFDRDGADIESGTRLPCGWTLLYFLDCPPTSLIGRDGRTTPGEFIPDTGLPRRMWAGGSFTFERDLVLGRPARQTVTITGVERKKGRSGDLCFVTTEHRIVQDDQDAVIEVRNLVFRDAPRSSGEARRVTPPKNAAWQRSVVADPVLLFRFSALTFNGHRIHYDVEYCRNEEAYPDLVVHGPMQALLLLDLAERTFPERRIRHFRYRGVAPLFAPHPFLVCGKPEASGDLRLWIEDSSGSLATSAELEFA